MKTVTVTITLARSTEGEWRVSDDGGDWDDDVVPDADAIDIASERVEHYRGASQRYRGNGRKEVKVLREGEDITAKFPAHEVPVITKSGIDALTKW